LLLRILTDSELLGQATTLIAELFLGGCTHILGILGEYIGRIYDEVKGRPLYVVSEAPPKQNLKIRVIIGMAKIDLTVHPDRT
jgi:dolichol-phosphate mannosyltransferase